MVGRACRANLAGRQEKLRHGLGVGMAVLVGGSVPELHPKHTDALGPRTSLKADGLENGRLRKLAIKTTGHFVSLSFEYPLILA